MFEVAQDKFCKRALRLDVFLLTKVSTCLAGTKHHSHHSRWRSVRTPVSDTLLMLTIALAPQVASCLPVLRSDRQTLGSTGGKRVSLGRRFIVTKAIIAHDDGKLHPRANRDGTADASGSNNVLAPLTAFAVATILGLSWDVPPALAANPTYSGVDPNSSHLIKRLKKQTDENKETYNLQRLDNFYKRDYAINKLIGKELLPDPCDPRDPEFGYRCGSNLPRLPQSRLDPFDDRSQQNASRRGAVFGLNDLNIEEEPGFHAELIKEGSGESMADTEVDTEESIDSATESSISTDSTESGTDGESRRVLEEYDE